MTVGAFCTVLIAAAGAESNPLVVTVKSPMGKIVRSPAPKSEIELAHCAKVSGDHAVTVSPKTLDYFTLTAMECPRWVAVKRQAH